ncbi:hypothetical protein ACWMNP_12030 (plasmid) [Cetobacterium ceti]
MKYNRHLSFRAGEDLISEIEHYADKLYLDKSKFIILAIEEYIQKLKDE